MGWGEAHGPANGGAGTTGQIEDALHALAAVGIHGRTLALAAIEAAGAIDTLHQERDEIRRALRGVGTEAVMRHVRQEDTGSGAR